MKVKVTKKGNIILKTQNEYEKAFVETLQVMLTQAEQAQKRTEDFLGELKDTMPKDWTKPYISWGYGFPDFSSRTGT